MISIFVLQESSRTDSVNRPDDKHVSSSSATMPINSYHGINMPWFGPPVYQYTSYNMPAHPMPLSSFMTVPAPPSLMTQPTASSCKPLTANDLHKAVSPETNRRPSRALETDQPTTNSIPDKSSDDIVKDNSLYEALQCVLQSDCNSRNSDVNVLSSLVDKTPVQSTDMSVPLTVKISVLNLRFMSLSNRYKTRVQELEQMYRMKAAELESERYSALCSPGVCSSTTDVYYDQQHHSLISRIEHSLRILQQKQHQNIKCKQPSTSPANSTDDNIPEPQPDYKRKHNNFQPLNSVSVKIMSSWYERNQEHPYPGYETCEVMAKAGNLTVEQVKKWFSNHRRRQGNTKTLTQIASRRKRTRRDSSVCHESKRHKMVHVNNCLSDPVLFTSDSRV